MDDNWKSEDEGLEGDFSGTNKEIADDELDSEDEEVVSGIPDISDIGDEEM